MDKHSSRYKCTKEEAEQFRDKVWDFLEKEKLPYEKIYTSKKYGGECRGYTGRTIESIPKRRSRRLVAYKENGVWKGDEEFIAENKDILATKSVTSSIWLKDYFPKQVPQYFSVYREDDWKEEKKELSDWLKKQEWVRQRRLKEKQ